MSSRQGWTHRWDEKTKGKAAAEALLEAVAEEDVADTAVLSDLRTALEEAKSIPSLTGLEMGVLGVSFPTDLSSAMLGPWRNGNG